MANRNITITCAYGKPTIDGVVVAAGVNVVADGSHIFAVKREYSMETLVTQPHQKRTYRCKGWTDGSGDFAANGNTITMTVTITQAGAFTWHWHYISACPVCGDTIVPTEGDEGVKIVCGSCGYDNTESPVWTET
jgi:hypothetical protein